MKVMCCRSFWRGARGFGHFRALRGCLTFRDESIRVASFQSGSYLGEDDMVRLEDRYGRS